MAVQKSSHVVTGSLLRVSHKGSSWGFIPGESSSKGMGSLTECPSYSCIAGMPGFLPLSARGRSRALAHGVSVGSSQMAAGFRKVSREASSTF